MRRLCIRRVVILVGLVFFLTGCLGRPDGGGPSGGGPSGSTPPLFGIPTYRTPDTSFGMDVEVGDVDGDGILDFVVASSGNTINVFPYHALVTFYGFGDGSFGGQQSYNIARGLYQVELGDLNGDGMLDAVVSDGEIGNPDQAVAVFSDSHGAFSHHAPIFAGRPVEIIKLGDLNADGALDLAAIARDFNSTIWFGRGDGTFDGKPLNTDFRLGQPRDVALGDVDLNGLLDIVVFTANPYTLTALLANENGEYTRVRTREVESSNTAMALGDISGDGLMDVVLSNASLGKVFLLTGTGGGSFVTGGSYDVEVGSEGIAIGDVDGDTFLDVVCSKSGFGGLLVLFGNGDGTLEPPQAFDTNDYLVNPKLADVDSDGLLDVVAEGGETINEVGVVLFHDTRPAVPPQSFPIDGTVQAIAAADLNGDGVEDVVTANLNSTVSVLLGVSGGTFQPAQPYSTGSLPRGIALGDLNGDDVIDAITANLGSDNLSVHIGNGDGTFQPAQPVPNFNDPASIALADFNEDDILDAVVHHSDVSTFFTISLGVGNGTFMPPAMHNVGVQIEALVASDINGDNRPDILFLPSGTSAGAVSIMLNVGGATFDAPTAFPVGPFPRSLATGDLNGDGLRDCVTFNSGSRDISVLLGHGNGSFSQEVWTSIIGVTVPQRMMVSDVDGDGLDDVVGVGSGGGHSDVRVHLSNGDGTVQAGQVYKKEGGVSTLAVFDANNDDRLDIVVGAQSNVTVFLQQ